MIKEFRPLIYLFAFGMIYTLLVGLLMGGSPTKSKQVTCPCVTAK